jgi:hypothetical protein
LAFLYKYRSYFLPAVLAVLLIVAISKPPQESLSTSAHRLENLITDAQNSFDKICLSDLGDPAYAGSLIEDQDLHFRTGQVSAAV